MPVFTSQINSILKKKQSARPPDHNIDGCLTKEIVLLPFT
jgi:hypothetical protein